MIDQVDGIAMGSPLAPALANMFMGFHEEKWLSSTEGKKVRFYKRYVDDVFCLVDDEIQADSFLQFLNIQHTNIKFTTEKENDKALPFLDIFIQNTELGIITSVYKKPTNSGLLTNFDSFVCFKYKIGLIKTLFDRIFKINNKWKGFNENLCEMKETLQKNNFPSKLIDENVKTAYNNKMLNKTISKNDESRFFKLSYIGSFSRYAEKRIKLLIDKYCKKGTSIKLAFTSFKISQYFQIKDKRLKYLDSFVIYKFTCRCKSKYVGFTTRHLKERIDEHLKKDKKSHILKHLESSIECKEEASENSFKVIDRANSELDLKMKEAMWIQWISPELNVQKLNSTSLTIDV